MSYYLAIDIGASSGRHILCHVSGGKLICEEIYRFKNGAKKNGDGTLCWDRGGLVRHVIEGMKRCREAEKIPVSVGIDTWGVDFLLIDHDGNTVGNAVAYRDSRTDGVTLCVTDEELYRRSGIQKQKFNTVYQLAYLKENKPHELMSAASMLMMPDYLNYALTGKVAQEYTIATTTGLIDAAARDWDLDLIDRLGLPRGIFSKISAPVTRLGRLQPTVAKEVGYDCDVVMCASHDTASAVLAVPSTENDFIYISSGTWSLMGIETNTPCCSNESRALNFTNEGGVFGTYRYLKNIMGLWMIQELRREVGDAYSFAELCDMAERADCDSIVDCADECFLAPASMTEAIRSYCREHSLPLPASVGDVARVIYRSLATCYAKTKDEIEYITKKQYSRIHIIGGGSNADYLNRLTAEATGCEVYAGPGEATAYGNIAAQLIADGVCATVHDVRQILSNTFDLKYYKGQGA